jgi:hypothetical protein
MDCDKCQDSERWCLIHRGSSTLCPVPRVDGMLSCRSYWVPCDRPIHKEKDAAHQADLTIRYIKAVARHEHVSLAAAHIEAQDECGYDAVFLDFEP